jgi:hypothetical protein
LDNNQRDALKQDRARQARSRRPAGRGSTPGGIGAGRHERALRVAWTGAAIAAGLTEAIGLAAACFPAAWLSLFSRDAEMIKVGTSYLRIVGPFYGFFGGGLAPLRRQCAASEITCAQLTGGNVAPRAIAATRSPLPIPSQADRDLPRLAGHRSRHFW